MPSPCQNIETVIKWQSATIQSWSVLLITATSCLYLLTKVRTKETTADRYQVVERQQRKSWSTKCIFKSAPCLTIESHSSTTKASKALRGSLWRPLNLQSAMVARWWASATPMSTSSHLTFNLTQETTRLRTNSSAATMGPMKKERARCTTWSFQKCWVILESTKRRSSRDSFQKSSLNPIWMRICHQSSVR